MAYVQVFVELPFLRFHGPRKNNRRRSATLRIVLRRTSWDLRPRLSTTAAPRLNGSRLETTAAPRLNGSGLETTAAPRLNGSGFEQAVLLAGKVRSYLATIRFYIGTAPFPVAERRCWIASDVSPRSVLRCGSQSRSDDGR